MDYIKVFLLFGCFLVLEHKNVPGVVVNTPDLRIWEAEEAGESLGYRPVVLVRVLQTQNVIIRMTYRMQANKINNGELEWKVLSPGLHYMLEF